MKEGIVIIGAGGHGKVIADAIIQSNQYELIGFVDGKTAVGAKIIGDYGVIETQDNLISLISSNTRFIIGIGNNEVRKKVQNELDDLVSFATIIHPSAVISTDVKIGEGSVVLANAIINAGSVIGKFSIIDSGVIVDHDCEIGDFSHLSVGTVVGSNNKLASDLKSELAQVFKPFTNP